MPHDANQSTASKGTAGQVWVTVSQGGQTLWRFLAVRPAASSGTNGSGIELRYVDYKGNACCTGPTYQSSTSDTTPTHAVRLRDWQYQEGMIQAQGIDVAPGFRFSSGPALTIMDTGSDTGNFLGVGIYVLFNEVVFVSEMEAGWYRYITQWRLGTNGTIRPRFGFTTVEHQCVCNVHHHHVYWRLDFDIRTAGNNRVREFNDPPLIGNQNWHTKRFKELRRTHATRPGAPVARREHHEPGRATTSSRSSTTASARDHAGHAVSTGRCVDPAIPRQRDRRRCRGDRSAIRGQHR